MICKYLEQNVLFPNDLNWVQHLVSRMDLWLRNVPKEKKKVPRNCDFLDADDVVVVIALVLKASRMSNEFEKCKLKIISYHFDLNF